ncbi:MAG: SDR family oxidoreductase [Verrucomicrobiales bacterium]
MTPRTILITGANGGLGIAIARAFLEDPASHRVILGVRHRRDAAEALAASQPDRIMCVELEVTSAEAWADALKRTGPIAVLVNNAGSHADALLATMPRDSWTSVLSSNLDGTFLGCQAVVRDMIAARWGRIVNVASLSALLAPAGQTNYAAAKAGVVALTQSLAKEVARAGITVNAVCPGFIDTEALASLGADTRKTRASQIPMRRFGRPEEVAAAIHFLASEAASYITGAQLRIDGGLL